MSRCDIFCVCVSIHGKRCPYRATNKETRMCGVHNLFKHKDDLKKIEICFPDTFSNHI